MQENFKNAKHFFRGQILTLTYLFDENRVDYCACHVACHFDDDGVVSVDYFCCHSNEKIDHFYDHDHFYSHIEYFHQIQGMLMFWSQQSICCRKLAKILM